MRVNVPHMSVRIWAKRLLALETWLKSHLEGVTHQAIILHHHIGRMTLSGWPQD